MIKLSGALVLFGVLALTSTGGCSGMQTVRIDAPTPCHKLDKVEGDQVFLRSDSEICTQVISKIPVTLDSSVTRVKVLVNDRLWVEQDIVADGAEEQK